jgi:2-C-methyl-D-erythritol 4-phosphate cytidylyltransferase
VPVRVVLGGSTRQASVAAGLAQAPPDTDIVLVHDAARPLVPPELIARVVESVRAGHRAVVPGLPVTDTLKRVLPGGSVEPVAATVERAPLRAVQTPQGFDRELLELAHAAATHRSADESTAATDDAGLVEALGEPVVVVAGDERAAKITTAHDLRVATLTLQEER